MREARVLVNALIAAERGVIDIAAQNRPVDVYVTEVFTDIRSGGMNVGKAPRRPGLAALPPEIIDAVGVPVEVDIQPDTDGVGRSPGESTISRVNHHRIVIRHVEILRLLGPDLDVAAVIDYLHLRIALQIARGLRFGAETLHRCHHIVALVDVCLAQSGGPIQLIGHHVQCGRVMRDGFHAHVPGLAVDVAGIGIGAHKPRGFVDLVGKCRSHQKLCEQRIRVERDLRQ